MPLVRGSITRFARSGGAIRRALGTCLAVAVLLTGFASLQSARAELAIVPIKHAPLSITKNDVGAVTYGQGYSRLSYNWSGYALENWETGVLYTNVSGSWTVPVASYKTPGDSCYPIAGWGFATSVSCVAHKVPTMYSAAWVGIGGACTDQTCRYVDQTLIQTGTSSDVKADGTPDYYAWYEMLPDYMQVIGTDQPCDTDASGKCFVPRVVKPGDKINTLIRCESNCTPGHPSQTWLISIADITQDWIHSIYVPYSSSLLSVEWVQEAPSSSAGVLPLAKFEPVTFTVPAFNSQLAYFPTAGFGGMGRQAITMINNYGQTAVPSPPIVGNTFSVCWGDNRAMLAPCAVP